MTTTTPEPTEPAAPPPAAHSPSTIEVLPPTNSNPQPVAPSEGSSDAHSKNKHKRRSGNSVDLTYRYHEPSDDELSWTEDEHGTRRRRKSKKKSGGGDDFKTGIMYSRVVEETDENRPSEGKKRRRMRRSGESAQAGDEDDVYSAGESESESELEDDNGKK